MVRFAYLVHVAVDLSAQEMMGMDTDCELRFDHLFHVGRAFVFPCDAKGRVDLDSLSTRARNNYFFARAPVGREVTPCPAMTRPYASEEKAESSLRSQCFGRYPYAPSVA